nr:ribonuclease H-like domain-containing protein [Tanacetum cinerariifolium]
MQDKNIANSELKKLIEKGKGKSVDTKFDIPFVVRQPNAQRIPKPLVLGKPTPFSNSLDRIYFQKKKLVPKANVSEGLSKPVTAQTLPQTTKKAVSNTNVLKPGMYRIDNRRAHTRAPQLSQTVWNTNPRVSTFTGVNHKPIFNRPHLKSNQSKDKVLPNNSQVKAKKTQVEVHPRIPSVSNEMKSVTALRQFFVMEIWFKEMSRSTGFTMSKASIPISSKLSHLNFDNINLLSKKDIVIGLPKLKYVKDQLCSSCELSKAKRSSFKLKAVPSSKGRLNLLHMDLCGPMRVASINGKKDGENLDKMKEKEDQYILVGYSTQSKGYQETNNDQAEEGEQLQDDEFTNPFYAPTQEEAGSFSHNTGNSNVPTFNQPQ